MSTNETSICQASVQIASQCTVTGASIGSILHSAYTHITSWKGFCESYEDLQSKLSRILNTVQTPINATKNLKLTEASYKDLCEKCERMSSYSKDYFNFDVQNELVDAVGGGKTAIDREKLNNLISKMNKTVSRQLEKMLIFECLKTAAQTAAMIITLCNTWSVIRESKQFRQLHDFQATSIKIEEYLQKADKYWKKAHNEIERIENQSEYSPTQHELDKISFDLDKANFECECARRVLETIFIEIKQKKKSLSTNRLNHGTNIGVAGVNLAINVLEFVTTPTKAVSTLAKGLFAVNTLFQTTNVVGHSIGFCLSYNEICKLEEYQQEMNKLSKTIEDSLEKINYSKQKMIHFQQRIEIQPDPTIVIEQ
ncbi:unnamed protein product [Rotaria sp. Silwood2]|nr:unnamed protein product [Rotaria sp. Silwood2]CAF4373978.1 unnamed protein product [Rotaria sp. Silwood2]